MLTPDTFCTHEFGVAVSARHLLKENADTLARITRATEAIAVGDTFLAIAILGGLEAAIVQMSTALGNAVDRFDCR